MTLLAKSYCVIGSQIITLLASYYIIGFNTLKHAMLSDVIILLVIITLLAATRVMIDSH